MSLLLATSFSLLKKKEGEVLDASEFCVISYKNSMNRTQEEYLLTKKSFILFHN